jgi:3',5'-cyclic AMP phosphodiesterase CpdA
VFVLAQLSDPHLRGDPEATARLRQVVDHLAGLPRPVDAVLVTGDITDSGDPADYAAANGLFAALTPGTPVLFCPGNHDDRAAFRRVLLGETPAGEAPGPVNRAHQVGGVEVLLLDSSVPGESAGWLAPETLAWLDRRLAGSGRPALVALHHPPVPLGLPALDRIGLRDPGPFERVLRAHDRVLAVLCGHAHAGAAAEFAGRPLRAAPGITSTVLPPWEVGERYAMTDRLPPALAFHVLAGTALTTHFRAVPAPGPRRVP